MKLTRCVVASVLLAAVFLSTSAGQEAGPSAQARLQGAQPKVEKEFDSAKNETTVGFKMLMIRGTETEKLIISAEATYATESPKKHPEDVVFIISALSPSYRYPDINQLTITCDGKRLSPIVLLNLDKRPAEPLFLETLGTRMKYDVFIKLAKARSVQMEFAETSFALTDSHLALLSELADLMHL
jgi:hypothetical protein